MRISHEKRDKIGTKWLRDREEKKLTTLFIFSGWRNVFFSCKKVFFSCKKVFVGQKSFDESLSQNKRPTHKNFFSAKKNFFAKRKTFFQKKSGQLFTSLIHYAKIWRLASTQTQSKVVTTFTVHACEQY